LIWENKLPFYGILDVLVGIILFLFGVVVFYLGLGLSLFGASLSPTFSSFEIIGLIFQLVVLLFGLNIVIFAGFKTISMVYSKNTLRIFKDSLEVIDYSPNETNLGFSFALKSLNNSAEKINWNEVKSLEIKKEFEILPNAGILHFFLSIIFWVHFKAIPTSLGSHGGAGSQIFLVTQLKNGKEFFTPIFDCNSIHKALEIVQKGNLLINPDPELEKNLSNKINYKKSSLQNPVKVILGGLGIGLIVIIAYFFFEEFFFITPFPLVLGAISILIILTGLFGLFKKK